MGREHKNTASAFCTSLAKASRRPTMSSVTIPSSLATTTHKPLEKFPSIEQFRSVLKDIRNSYWADQVPTLQLEGTVKLHGTHADVLIHRNSGPVTYSVQYQSRNRVLSIQDDNCGFAMHMEAIPRGILEQFIEQFAAAYNEPFEKLTIAGEWCGGNIQPGVALSRLPKMFVVFGVRVDGAWQQLSAYKDIELPQHNVYNVLRGGVFQCQISIDSPQVDLLEHLTLSVEQECPFAKSFGVSGIGEGIVWRPANLSNCSRYWFKTKGSQHTVSKLKTLQEPSAEQVRALNNVEVFVQSVVTEPRLKQGLDYLREMNLPADNKQTGTFVNWILEDIYKEEKDSIVELRLDSKALKKQAQLVARRWYMSHV